MTGHKKGLFVTSFCVEQGPLRLFVSAFLRNSDLLALCQTCASCMDSSFALLASRVSRSIWPHDRVFVNLKHTRWFNCLTNITMVFQFDHADKKLELDWSCYPQNIETLRLCLFPFAAIPTHLDQTLRYLRLQPRGQDRNAALPSKLPANLTSLHLGDLWNGPIASLPSKLTELHLGSDFDQLLPALPESLKVLRFGFHYSRPLPRLPDGLEYLCLRECFNQPLLPLPAKLKFLHLDHDFDQPLPQPLPSSLETLELGVHYNQPLLALPASLRTLQFHNHSRFNQSLTTLPSNLQSLFLPSTFNHSAVSLPPNLKILVHGKAGCGSAFPSSHFLTEFFSTETPQEKK